MQQSLLQWDDALMSPFAGNHDVLRIATEMAGNDDGAWGATSDLLLDGGSSITQDSMLRRLAMAQAFTFTQPGAPMLYYGDEIGLAGGGDPDNRRLMPWDDTQLLPAQLELRSHLQKLAQIRQEFKSLSRGTRQTLRVDADSWVYKTSCQDDRFEDLMVVINRGDAPLNDAAVPAGNYLDLLSNTMFSGTVRVEPRSMLILRRVRE